MMNKKTVLIAEDEPLILKSVIFILKKKFTVYGAVDGREAWGILTSNKIDCLVTDIKMPNMNGLELLEKMKAQNLPAKTIVTTGFMCPDTRKRCINAGVNLYMEKPYNITKLIEGISNVTADSYAHDNYIKPRGDK